MGFSISSLVPNFISDWISPPKLQPDVPAAVPQTAPPPWAPVASNAEKPAAFKGVSSFEGGNAKASNSAASDPAKSAAAKSPAASGEAGRKSTSSSAPSTPKAAVAAAEGKKSSTAMVSAQDEVALGSRGLVVDDKTGSLLTKGTRKTQWELPAGAKGPVKYSVQGDDLKIAFTQANGQQGSTTLGLGKKLKYEDME